MHVVEYPRLDHAGAARFPTATMGTFEFEALARLEAKNRGIEDLPLALVPHPLGGIHEEEVVKKADLALEAVLRALTIP